MPRFAANVSLLFTEYPLAERFRAAREHGFQAVEIQFPYELPAEYLQSLLQEQALKLVLFNVDADTLLQGGEGLAAVPEKRSAFEAAVAKAVQYAQILQPEKINVLPGRCLNPQRLPDYLQTLQTNLRYAADAFAQIGVTTVFEAINRYDMPGCIVDSGAMMLSIWQTLAHPHLRLQYDIYHMSRMQEDCLSFIRQHIDKIGHLQFADCPGRGQPGTGTVDFASLFALVDALPYAGWLGAEYKPQGATQNSLQWLQPYLSSAVSPL